MKRSIIALFLCGVMSWTLSLESNGSDSGNQEAVFKKDGACGVRSKKKRCKKLGNLVVSNCLSTRQLSVDNNVIIEGDLTVDTITDNNTSTTICVFPSGGLDGQALIGSTNATPVFNALSSSNDSILFTPGAGLLGLKGEAAFGNVARVDQIYGSDTLGAVNGRAFKTITAALAQAGSYATATTPVVVWVFPGVYSNTGSNPETFPLSIPNNVGLIGLSQGSGPTFGGVTIEQLNATGAATLIIMGQNSLLENASLALTSADDVALIGISIPNIAIISSVNLTVNNTSGGSSNVYGIYATGSGVSSTVDDATIIVSSTGTQSTRGLLVDTTHSNTVDYSTITASNTGGGNAIGVETSGNASSTLSASTISGTNADISQDSNTTITLEGTTLGHFAASGQGFTTTFSPTTLSWNYYAANANTPRGTFFMVPGTAMSAAQLTAGAANFGYIVPQQSLVRNLYVVAQIQGPGVGHTATFTLYQNGAPTALSVSLAGTATEDSNTTTSLLCQEGDVLSMEMDNSANSVLRSPGVSVQLY